MKCATPVCYMKRCRKGKGLKGLDRYWSDCPLRQEVKSKMTTENQKCFILEVDFAGKLEMTDKAFEWEKEDIKKSFCTPNSDALVFVKRFKKLKDGDRIRVVFL